MVMCVDGKERFPRINAKSFKGMSRVKKLKAQLAMGIIPKNYDRLSTKQKDLARKVARGMSAADACKLVGVEQNSYYQWMHCHPLFRACFKKYAMRYATKTTEHLDEKLPRAVQVVSDSLDSRDPYFRHDVAVQLLKGRGHYRPTHNVQSEIRNRTTFDGSVGVNHSHKMDKEFVEMFVGALKGKAQTSESKKLTPKIIDVEVLKELPPADGTPQQI